LEKNGGGEKLSEREGGEGGEKRFCKTFGDKRTGPWHQKVASIWQTRGT